MALKKPRPLIVRLFALALFGVVLAAVPWYLIVMLTR